MGRRSSFHETLPPAWGLHEYWAATGADWARDAALRAADALDILEQRRLPDGRWRPGGYWWRYGGRGTGPLEVVDWGRDGPCEMLTLNAQRCLRAAGR